MSAERMQLKHVQNLHSASELVVCSAAGFTYLIAISDSLQHLATVHTYMYI